MSELISSRRNVLKSALGLAAAATLPAGAFAKGSSRAAVTATCSGVVSHSSRGGVFFRKVQTRLREPWKMAKSERTPVLAEPTWATRA